MMASSAAGSFAGTAVINLPLSALGSAALLLSTVSRHRLNSA